MFLGPSPSSPPNKSLRRTDCALSQGQKGLDLPGGWCHSQEDVAFVCRYLLGAQKVRPFEAIIRNGGLQVARLAARHALKRGRGAGSNVALCSSLWLKPWFCWYAKGNRIVLGCLRRCGMSSIRSISGMLRSFCRFPLRFRHLEWISRQRLNLSTKQG